MKHHEHPAWNQGRNATHAPEHNLDVVKTLGIILAATFVPIGVVSLLVAIAGAFA
jgi:hypothetical protein